MAPLSHLYKQLLFVFLVTAINDTDKAYYRSFPRVDFSQAQANDPRAIGFKLYTRENPNSFTILTEDNVERDLVHKYVNTILIAHGWNSSERTPWYELIREAYFRRNNYNIISLDWSAYSNKTYGVSAANVQPVGEFVAVFLHKTGVPTYKIHLIGHSLGAQLAAFIAKAYKKRFRQKFARITALDPAGPSWSNENMKKEERLSEIDAEFVDVVHTDIQLRGYTLPCGHVDFYPNGGTNQPGCPDLEQNECNHKRAEKLFVESINTLNRATEIDIHEDEDYNIVITHKNNTNKVIFGEHVNTRARGVFYLKTNHEAPFLEGSTRKKFLKKLICVYFKC